MTLNFLYIPEHFIADWGRICLAIYCYLHSAFVQTLLHRT